MSSPQAPRPPYGEEPAEPAPWGGGPAGGWGHDPGLARRPEGAAWGVLDPDPGWAPSRPAGPPAWGAPSPPAPGDDRAGHWRPGHRDLRPDDRYGGPEPFTAVDPGRWGGPPSAAHPPLPAPGTGADRGRGPLVAIGALVAAAAVLGLLAFVAPGFLVTRVFDAAAMERDVARVLVEDHGIGGVSAVGCSGRVRVVADTRFECTATIDGAAVAVPMRVIDDDGGYEVGRPS